MRHGALAIGARDMDREIALMRIAYLMAEVTNTLQARLIGVGTNLLKRRGGGKEILYGLGIIHNIRLY